ncbi:MAG: hypothetical protein J6U35_00640 [Clostridia bacterium]|nr:hypothetical protein [Clostridia bacterium]
MKGIFLNSIMIAAAIVGSVIGAGFITGAEIVRFFSGSNLLPACALLFVVLFLFFFSILFSGSASESEKRSNLCDLGGLFKISDVALLFFSFITLCGMCAGLDAVVADFFNFDPRIPSLSPVMLLLSLFVCGRGIGGVEKFNAFLVPVMIAAIFFATANGLRAKAPFPAQTQSLPILVYAAMNCFLSSPVVFDGGKKKSVAAVAVGAALSSLIISASVYFIMKKVSVFPVRGDLPLLSAIEQGGFRVFFSVVTLFGIATTLVSSHYPLVGKISESPRKRALNAVLAVAALAFSRLGFQRIVYYLYPVIGVFGLLFCGAICVRAAKLLFADDELFRKRHERVHSGGKQA